jgi:hypothetical protein
MSNLDDLAAAMNRQVTDDQGQTVADDTAQEESATQEQTTVEEDATAEKPVDTNDSTPVETKESENEPEMVELASDETGKRYVPESRFKEVYAKWKAAERGSSSEQPKVDLPIAPTQTVPFNKQDALEVEILESTMPQFNVQSDQYDRDIDLLGSKIYNASRDAKGNYTMTKLQAAKEALAMAKKITSKVADVKLEAKSVKVSQSDQGITNRVLNREGQQLDPDKMTLAEKEEWLKASGSW